MNKYSTSIRKNFAKQELIDIFKIRDLVNINDSNISNILNDFGFDVSTIDFSSSQITMRIDEEEKVNEAMNIAEMINITYYDEHDNITEYLKKIPSIMDIISFEGEIFENLNFKTKEEVNKFLIEHNYESYIDQDTKAIMHFRARELNKEKLKKYMNMEKETIKSGMSEQKRKILEKEKNKTIDTKDIYITKNKNLYTIFYGAPYYYNNDENISNFTCSEIDKIIKRIEHIDSGCLLLYVKSALVNHKENISNRGFVPNNNFIDSKSLQVIENSIVYNDTLGNVSVKLKVISDNMVKFKDEETKKLVLKK